MQMLTGSGTGPATSAEWINYGGVKMPLSRCHKTDGDGGVASDRDGGTTWICSITIGFRLLRIGRNERPWGRLLYSTETSIQAR